MEDKKKPYQRYNSKLGLFGNGFFTMTVVESTRSLLALLGGLFVTLCFELYDRKQLRKEADAEQRGSSPSP